MMCSVSLAQLNCDFYVFHEVYLLSWLYSIIMGKAWCFPFRELYKKCFVWFLGLHLVRWIYLKINTYICLLWFTELCVTWQNQLALKRFREFEPLNFLVLVRYFNIYDTINKSSTLYAEMKRLQIKKSLGDNFQSKA